MPNIKKNALFLKKKKIILAMVEETDFYKMDNQKKLFNKSDT